MLKDFLLFIKYPYTAGVIATIWLGSAALIAINPEIAVLNVVSVNMIGSVIVALVGFSGKQEF